MEPDSQASVKGSVEIEEMSGTVSRSESEGEAAEAEPMIEESTDETEDLSNYQLARDRIRREIVKPARFTEDSKVAFALSVAEVVEATEPSSFDEAMRSRDWKKWNA